MSIATQSVHSLQMLRRRLEARAAPLCRFARAREAATAVEFALVATPFFALVFAILQTAIIFFASQTLETATANASRLILTGQAQSSSWTAAQFKQQVCAQIYAIFNCTSNVYVDVESYAAFSSVNTSLPVTNGNFDTSQLGYHPGGPGAIVMVRLYYQYPVYVNLLNLSSDLSNLNGGYNLLAATAVFKTEPY